LQTSFLTKLGAGSDGKADGKIALKPGDFGILRILYKTAIFSSSEDRALRKTPSHYRSGLFSLYKRQVFITIRSGFLSFGKEFPCFRPF
jgi:hypothetical protein